MFLNYTSKCLSITAVNVLNYNSKYFTATGRKKKIWLIGGKVIIQEFAKFDLVPSYKKLFSSITNFRNKLECLSLASLSSLV
jgi:hypothetical protein